MVCCKKNRLMANSWGSDWGEGGYWRSESSFILGGDLYAVNMPASPKCSDKPSCQHGAFDNDCACTCSPFWFASTHACTHVYTCVRAHAYGCACTWRERPHTLARLFFFAVAFLSIP